MAFELWDTETNNLVGNYDTREAALQIVQNAIQAHGVDATARLALGYEDRQGRTTLIAQGTDLIELAQRRPAIRGQHESLARPA
ncbi:MAG: hypothetical protein ACRDJW_08065 [Thermomicrobiales bacterium]